MGYSARPTGRTHPHERTLTASASRVAQWTRATSCARAGRRARAERIPGMVVPAGEVPTISRPLRRRAVAVGLERVGHAHAPSVVRRLEHEAARAPLGGGARR